MSVRDVLADNRPSWHNPRVLLLLTMVFVAGFAGGVLATKLTVAPITRAGVPGWQEGGRVVTLDMLTKELKLSPEQASEVETVLDDFVLHYQNLQGQMDDWRLEGKKRITRVLTPEQQKKFESLMQQMHKQAMLR